jgi:hypothetical protein
MCGTKAWRIRFRGSSGRSAAVRCCPRTPPPNTDSDIILDGVEAPPLGETDLDPDGVDVDAKREETEAFEVRYGSVDIEDAIDCGSDALSFGNLSEEELDGGSGDSKGEALGGVMKTNRRSSAGVEDCDFGAQ